MRLIDADALKEKLLKMQDDIVNKSDAWKPAYMLVFDEYIKIVDKMPSAEQHYDCNHDCDTLHEAYDNGYSKGFSEGKKEEKKELMLLTDRCIRKCDMLDSMLKRKGGKHETN